MIKTYVDKKNKFKEIFNTKNGTYIRTSVLDENGKDTGIDPFMRDFPALIDIGVMGHCIHGASGLCAKSGVQCYQNGLKTCEPNMSLDNFKKIVDECKDRCFQFALGGRGDVDQHENFVEILQYCVENDIVPNFTTSGLGMTKEIAETCKKYCGAVAVSMYSRLDSLIPDIAMRKLPSGETRTYTCVEDIPVLFTFNNKNKDCFWDAPHYIVNGIEYQWEELHHIQFSDKPQEYEYFRIFNEKNSENKNNIPNYTVNAVNMLLEAGVTTNIHYVLGNNTIDEAIIRLKNNGFPKGINAVIFLLHKPVGLGKEENVLDIADPRVKEFFSLIDNSKFAFQIGFDSCTVPGIINSTKNIAPESIDSCEGGRYSMYITSDMKALPCSFDNQEMNWAFDISNSKIENAWNSDLFNDFRNHFLNSCPNCPNRTSCYGGCPIRRQTVLCSSKNKNLK